MPSGVQIGPSLRLVFHDGKHRGVDELAAEIAHFALPLASEPADPKAFVIITSSLKEPPSFRHNFSPLDVARIPDFLRGVADAIEKG